MKRRPVVVGVVILACVAALAGVLAGRDEERLHSVTPTSTVRPAPTTTRDPFAGHPGAPPADRLGFPIPAGARFVAERGSDDADGSADTPWRTVQHAIDTTGDGGTIVVHGGVYRESLVVRHKTLTIQSFPHEHVFMRGSDPITPRADGAGRWRVDGWDSARFARQHADWTTPDDPMANAPDLVFFDGRSLQQVASRSEVRDGTFFVDASKQVLLLGSDPSGHEVEAARRSTGLVLDQAPKSVVRGITFDRFATPLDSIAAVVDKSTGATFEDDVFADNATGGLSILGDDAVVRGCSMTRNGQLGLHAYRANRMLVDGSVLEYNNVERFSTRVQAGGAKISDSDAVTIQNSQAVANFGDGIWFDLGATHAVVVHDEARANTGDGIQYEISSDAVIGANLAIDNVGNGIRVLESQRVDVVDNTLVRNSRGVEILEGKRPQDVQDVHLANNLFFDGQAGATALFGVDDVTRTRSGTAMRVHADGDVYLRSNVAVPASAVIWSEGARGLGRFERVGTFAATYGEERHAREADGVKEAGVFRDPANDDYTLVSGSPYRTGGVPLSDALRQALGLDPAAARAVGAFTG